jgi:membrane-bound lytic murein transglycosylase A
MIILQRSGFVHVVLVLFVIGFAGCVAVTPTEPGREKLIQPMQQLEVGAYPDFTDDLDLNGLADGISRSLEYFERVPPDRSYTYGTDSFSAAHIRQSLELFREFIQTQPSADELQAFIRDHYRVYQSAGRDEYGEVLFTGYYEPHLRGSRTATPEYAYPIYAKPQDLITIDLSQFAERFAGEKITARIEENSVKPYFDREQIDSDGVLEGRAEILAWVADPVDIFFLHIQGSGKIYLDDGQVINVHYHTANGRPYRSIGKLLIDDDKISREEMSMQKIREYLQTHPDEIKAVLYHNPSYIFFKIEEEGPLGNINVKLTPGRSLALDYRIFPRGALVFAETQKPEVTGDGQIAAWGDYHRFMLHQDTGGAIRGAGRADIFWGNGPYAEIAAGHLKHTGKLYFLVLEPDN